MDIEHMTHTGYRTSILIAVILSCLIVVLSAALGRGTLNLKGSLLLDEPTDVTVIAVVEPRLDDGVTISDIVFLRKQDAGAEKPTYDYQVETSDGGIYLVRLSQDPSITGWSLQNFERLRE